LARCFNNIEETINLDEWKKVDSLPRVSLAFHINIKVTWIKVMKGR
tara:strand:- start:94 stop:231 length:138 start_codon:yes stop_codon:yes gene_type:complete